MISILIGILVLVSIALIVTILLQSGQGGGLSAGFGGSFMSGAVFGGKGASGFLTKLTIGLAITFAVLVIGINVAYKQTGTTSNTSSAFSNAVPVSEAPLGSGVPATGQQVNPTATPVPVSPATEDAGE